MPAAPAPHPGIWTTDKEPADQPPTREHSMIKGSRATFRVLREKEQDLRTVLPIGLLLPQENHSSHTTQEASEEDIEETHEKVFAETPHSRLGNTHWTSQGWFLLSFLPSSWRRAQHESDLCTETEVALVSFQSMGLDGYYTSMAHQTPYKQHHCATSIYRGYYVLPGCHKMNGPAEKEFPPFQLPVSRVHPLCYCGAPRRYLPTNHNMT